MGDKRFDSFGKVASECGSTPKDAISGAKYVPPAAEVTVFALEKGFAISNEVKTQGAPGGTQKYGKVDVLDNKDANWNGTGWGDETVW